MYIYINIYKHMHLTKSMTTLCTIVQKEKYTWSCTYLYIYTQMYMQTYA